MLGLGRSMSSHGIIIETSADVFVYTGEGGESPPQNIVRVKVDPSVTSIPARAFYERKKLTEVELCPSGGATNQ